MRHKIIFVSAVALLAVAAAIISTLLFRVPAEESNYGESIVECECDWDKISRHEKRREPVKEQAPQITVQPKPKQESEVIQPEESVAEEDTKETEEPKPPPPVKIEIDARTPKKISFSDIETLCRYIEEETLKKCPFDYARETKALCRELNMKEPPELADTYKIEKTAKEQAEKLADARFPESMKGDLLSEARKKFTLIKVGDEATFPIRFGEGELKITGRVKSICAEANTLKSEDTMPNVTLESGQKIPLLDLPKTFRMRLTASGVEELVADWIKRNYDIPKAELLRRKADEIKSEMYEKLTKDGGFYKLLKEKKDARTAWAKSELLRKHLPDYLQEKLSFCQGALTQTGKRKRYEKLLDEIRLARDLCGPAAMEIAKGSVDLDKIKRIIDALSGEDSGGGRESANKEETEDGAVALIPAYKLLDNSENYLGRTVIVTGMLSKTVEAAEGRRIDLCQGLVNAFPRDRQEDKREFEEVGRFFEAEKKVYSNKTSRCRDSLAKLTLKGTAKRGLKPGTVLLENCSILRWYAVIIKGASKSKGGKLRLDLVWKKSLSPKSSKNAKKRGKIYGETSPRTDPAANMANGEELLIGTLTLSKKSMKARRINIDKKTTVFIGDDPFSFLTEVHEISTVMKRKGWKSDLELTIKAKKLGGPVRNKHASQYSDAEILSWRSMTQDVFLYGIVNDIPLFKAQLLEMKE